MPDLVTPLYAKIAGDRRHDRIVTLQRRTVAQRSFSAWSMGLMKTDSKALKGAPGLNEFLTAGVLTLAEDSERLSKILDGFRLGRWRQNIV
jgi:Sensors of blue-light using FAD